MEGRWWLPGGGWTRGRRCRRVSPPLDRAATRAMRGRAQVEECGAAEPSLPCGQCAGPPGLRRAGRGRRHARSPGQVAAQHTAVTGGQWSTRSSRGSGGHRAVQPRDDGSAGAEGEMSAEPALVVVAALTKTRSIASVTETGRRGDRLGTSGAAWPRARDTGAIVAASRSRSTAASAYLRGRSCRSHGSTPRTRRPRIAANPAARVP